ncbi:MAG: hypothetical protein QOJ39_1584 [Candidatus Eremiobacteraeota bacterium]|jgi:hypothetical protein|nr:hypothetical protein [Candidatus Eremiobacteraeota bacterium]
MPRTPATVTDETGTITFSNFNEPPMESGRYDATLEHHVASTDSSNAFDETFALDASFLVQGVRFAIPPGYVNMQFPPPNAQGEYDNVIPHIVFTARTLPWQRDAQAENDGTLYPWLALLTFDVADPPPALVVGTLGDLLNPPAETISYPNLVLEVGQSAADPVAYIDVDTALFEAVAPTPDDLPWLAHARTIDASRTLRKAFSANTVPGDEYSVIISNRLPTMGNATTCYLVSVENAASLLPGPQNTIPVAKTKVRLAVLSSWSFGCVTLQETFAGYLMNLSFEPSTPQVPYDSGGRPPNGAVQDALAMGYVPVNHHTRQGADTVSWYRGPLLPYDNPEQIDVPIPSADALVRYDPASGMFDVSYAAAWQIGQLLALQDAAFATTLYTWKQTQKQSAVIAFERGILGELSGVDSELLGAGAERVHVTLMREAFTPLLRALLAKGA